MTVKLKTRPAGRPATPVATAAGPSSMPEPTEARFRAWALVLAAVLVPPLLLALYFKLMFPGLTNPDAMDYAQIGRNLSAGQGFATHILRPLALQPELAKLGPLNQPDLTHGPLFPFLLALAFGALGAKGVVAAGVSGFFYLAAIPVAYLLGRRVFGAPVGAATALLVTFNSLMLEYAASGLPITLYVFLMTALLLASHSLATYARDTQEQAHPAFPNGPLLMMGLLTGLLYLTDPVFVWVIPITTAAVFWLGGPRRGAAVARFLLPLALLTIPWMVRNAMLTGNPVFGLRGSELWMYTKGHYPALTAYRLRPAGIIPGEDMVKAVCEKIAVGLTQFVQSASSVIGFWLLAFLLPSLLFRFTDPATNALRRVLMGSFVAILVGSLLFSIQLPLFVSLLPTMLVFAVGYLRHLMQQAQLTRAAAATVVALLASTLLLPLLSVMVLTDKTPPTKETPATDALKTMARRDDIVLSDQPWLVAWYADRPSLWLPARDADLVDLRTQFPQTRWLFLTDQADGLSPEWQYVHGAFAQWDLLYAQSALSRKPEPRPLSVRGGRDGLFQALDGFVSVPPAKDTPPSAVIASYSAPPPSSHNGPNKRARH